MRIAIYTISTLFFLTIVISCQNESKTTGNNGPVIPATSFEEAVDNAVLPEIKEDPVKYWQFKKVKIQTGTKGYTSSRHTVATTGNEVEPNPISIWKEKGKIVLVSTGDYNDAGEIAGLTDFLFENGQLGYIQSDDYRLYIDNNDIYLWLDKKGNKLTKSDDERKEMLESQNSRLNSLMQRIGVKL